MEASIRVITDDIIITYMKMVLLVGALSILLVGMMHVNRGFRHSSNYQARIERSIEDEIAPFKVKIKMLEKQFKNIKGTKI